MSFVLLESIRRLHFRRHVPDIQGITVLDVFVCVYAEPFIEHRWSILIYV